MLLTVDDIWSQLNSHIIAVIRLTCSTHVFYHCFICCWRESYPSSPQAVNLITAVSMIWQLDLVDVHMLHSSPGLNLST